MKRYVKFIIPGVLLLVLGIWLYFFAFPSVYTDENLNGKTTLEEIISTYGNPDFSKTIMLSHVYQLFEYQGGLAKYCPTDGSSRKIVELTFKKHDNRVLKIWYEQIDDNAINVLDNLEWDSDKIQF